jgi:hypothetical protein
MAKHTIALKGEYTRKERICGSGAITPGMLLELQSDNTVLPHGTAGGFVNRWFALENDLVGKGVGDPATASTDDYASDETVQIAAFEPGAEAYALLKSGQNVAIGTFLVSDGAGRLQAASSAGADEGLVGVALEAVNAAGGAARIKIEVL